jgi:homoserine trans-succinylase
MEVEITAETFSKPWGSGKCVQNLDREVLTEEATYRGADKSLARPTSRYTLFDGQNISFDASLVIYINSTNIPPIMIINRIYEHQNLLSL